MPVSESVSTAELEGEIVGILDGYRWITDEQAPLLTYSFASSVADFETYTWKPDNYDVSSVSPLSESERDDVRIVLQQVTNITGVQFEEVDDSVTSFGTLRYAHTDTLPEDFAGVGFTPGENKLDGDVWFSQSITPYDWFALVLHETGHALGLQHPHDGLLVLDKTLDGEEWTVMSYNFSATFSAAIDADMSPQTFMWLDILALQALYGVNTSFASGNDTYVFDAGSRYYFTLWDTGGTDRLDLSGQLEDLTINLTPGSWSDVGTDVTYFETGGRITGVRHETLFIPDVVTIEQVRAGAGDDLITGNKAANLLQGNLGDDTIHGGLGADTLAGGGGDDVVTDEGAFGVAWLGDGDDHFTATGSGKYTVGGGAGDDTIELGSGRDAAFAGAGDDRITDVGGGGAIWLGEGDDSAIISGAVGTSVGGRGGDDDIRGTAGADSLYGGAGDDFLSGGAAADQIFGGGGDDMLAPGAGDDSLWGGAGADTFIFGDDPGAKVLWGFSISDGDILRFEQIEDRSALLEQAEEQSGEDGTSVLISLGEEGSLLLMGMTLSDLTAAPDTAFLFG
ncbi:MAG: M10 family metallopeptidase C-terminal domain-containing protein [Alphaproteobacteria bacterium]|nr:M10 family metallopeptidase C-terminal domain-containing protein [Alphaproteobacteria bacterium]